MQSKLKRTTIKTFEKYLQNMFCQKGQFCGFLTLEGVRKKLILILKYNLYGFINFEEIDSVLYMYIYRHRDQEMEPKNTNE